MIDSCPKCDTEMVTACCGAPSNPAYVGLYCSECAEPAEMECPMCVTTVAEVANG